MFGELKTPEGIRNDQKVIDHGNLPHWPPSTCFGHVKARTWSRLSSRLFQILVTHFSYVYAADAAAVAPLPQVPLDTKRTRERENERGAPGEARGEKGKEEEEAREEEVANGTKRGNRSLLHAVRNSGSFRPLFFLASFLPSDAGETKDKLQRRPSCDPSHLSINDLVQSRENESTPKANIGGKSVIRTT